MPFSSDATNRMKKVVLVHPHTLFREGLSRILRDADFEVVGVSNTGKEFHQTIEERSPDVILIEYQAAEASAGDIRNLVDTCPSSTIAVLVSPESSKEFVPVMQAGATGYLSTNLTAEEFIKSLNMLLQGDIVVSRETIHTLKDALDNKGTKSLTDDLTEREFEVVQLIGHGQTNREIAEKLVISEHTVKVHLRSILNKLNLRNRQQIAAYAAQEEIVVNIETHKPS